MSNAAPFRLTQPIEEESVFVRAQSIIEAHARGEIKTLCESDRRALMQCFHRAKKAASVHANSEIEMSPYMVSVLRLEGI